MYPYRSDLDTSRRTGSAGECLLWSPEDVTIRFLESLAVGDAEIAQHLLASDVRYRFGLVIRHGRDRVADLLNRVTGPTGGFDVVIHEIVREDDVVTIHRTDHLRRGRVHLQFTARGTVSIREGRIVQWRDTVGAVAIAGAIVRGLFGAIVPSVRPTLPSA